MLLVMDISKSSYILFWDCEGVVEKEEGILGMKVADSVAQDFQGL